MRIPGTVMLVSSMGPRLQGVQFIALRSFSSTSARDQSFPEIRSSSVSQLKRGTGGRSSFNGHVCTIFGATGFIGNNLCNRLGRKGTQMIIPYRGDSYDVLRLRMTGDLGQVVFYPYDLRDYKSLREAVKYSDVVVNLIGRDWETMNFKFNDVHHTGAKMVARACKEMGVPKFIHVSALNAEEHPQSFLLKNGSQFLSSKWHGEMAVREEFPEAIIFRPSDCWGQDDRFLRYWAGWYRRQYRFMPLWRKGEYTVKQPVYGGDLAAGIVKAVLNPGYEGRTIDAVGPNRYLLSEMVDWFYRVMRRDAERLSYVRYDMRYDLSFLVRVALNTKFHYTWPKNTLVWDKVERESVSDVPAAGYDLQDMGIDLIKLEDRVDWELAPFRAFNYLEEDLNMFEKADPPPLYTEQDPPQIPEGWTVFGTA